MSHTAHRNKPFTVVSLTPVERMLVLIVPPVLGIVLGYFLPSIADWASHLPWVPFQGPLQLIASLQAKWVIVVTTIVGLIAGLWLTAEAMSDSLVIEVSDEEVRLRSKGIVQAFARSDVATAFIDGKQLVLLGKFGEELARETYESSHANVARAFGKHGFPWASLGDPYDTEYRLWVPDTPELSPAQNALLKSRDYALQKKERESAKEMYREAGKLGIVVRDKGNLQYWRCIMKDTEGKTNER